MFDPNKPQPPPLVSPDNNGRHFKPGIFLFVLGLVSTALCLIVNDFSSLFLMELAFIIGLIMSLLFILSITQEDDIKLIIKIILPILIFGAVGFIISNI